MYGYVGTTAVMFIVGLVVSTLIIFVVTKLFGEKERIGTAIGAALVGTVIYALAYFFLGDGLYAALIGGFVWLVAIAALYDVGPIRALGVAVIVWVAALFVGTALPTVLGPL